MKILFTRTFAVALVLVLTATGLWAGGADEEGSAAAADKKYVTDPTTGKVVTAPEYGGTFTFANTVEPPHADMALNGAVGLAVSGVVERLGIMNWAIDRDEFAFRSTYTPEFALRGHLAESWEMPDDKTFVFHIRQGVHWHNKPPMNGRELTADDVEYTFHRFLGSKLTGTEFSEAEPAPTLWGSLSDLAWESITATDEYTFVMKLKEPPPLGALVHLLGVWGANTFIYPPEVIKQHGDVKDWRNLVGTGPYEMTDWVEGSSITYTKNPNYWGHDEKYPENRLPYFDELQHLIIKEEATRLAGLRAGKIDFIGFTAGVSDITSVEVLDSLRRTNPEIVLEPWWDRSENSYGLDATKPPFDDIRVRQAMQMALDLEGIDRSVYKGTSAWRPQGILGEGLSGYFTPFEEWPEEVKSGYMYDPKAAEALLDAAGYARGADGTRFKTVLNHPEKFSLGYSELAASYWADIGVDVEINVMDAATEPPERNFRRGTAEAGQRSEYVHRGEPLVDMGSHAWNVPGTSRGSSVITGSLAFILKHSAPWIDPGALDSRQDIPAATNCPVRLRSDATVRTGCVVYKALPLCHTGLHGGIQGVDHWSWNVSPEI